MVGYNLSIVPQKPAWLDSLLSEKFFIACLKHAALKKNERNIFCVDCSDSICQHCLSSHRNHKLLQVRRYVYHDVIRLQDIQKLVDCSLVQTYIINSARVVFLNQRPQPRPPKGLGNACETCDRSLQDAYRYCSVACKVDFMVKQGRDLSTLLPRCNSLQLSDFFTASPAESLKDEKPDEEELSPNSILEDHDSQTSSGSTANDGGGCSAVTSTATTLPLPKESQELSPINCSQFPEASCCCCCCCCLSWQPEEEHPSQISIVLITGLVILIYFSLGLCSGSNITSAEFFCSCLKERLVKAERSDILQILAKQVEESEQQYLLLQTSGHVFKCR